MTLRSILNRIAEGERLSEPEAEDAFGLLMNGEATPAQIAGLLMGLRVRGETVEEMAGAVRAMRARMTIVPAPDDAIDVCGTGGDRSGTVNVSTAVGFVVAGCGVTVAKHGNRALSSRSGSADVLAALGVGMETTPEQTAQGLAEARIAFLMAPRYHAAMRHVAGARVELGIRTIFNLLGPMANPARVTRQLVGVFSPAWLEPMAETLGRLGAVHAWVVHGSDGLDELTTTGPSEVAEWRDGKLRRFQVTPEEAGLPLAPPDALKGGEPAENARALRSVLRGELGPYRDIVLLNAAASLHVAGVAPGLRDGVALAETSIASGSALRSLDRLVEITRMPEATE